MPLAGGADQLPNTAAHNAPSLVAQLKTQVVAKDGRLELRVSWAINVDLSTKHLTGTRILVDGGPRICSYTPSFADANLTGLTQLWFNYSVDIRPGVCVVAAANLPLPPAANGPADKSRFLIVNEGSGPEEAEGPSEHAYEYTGILVVLFGAVLPCFIILASCLTFCKVYRPHSSASVNFSKLPVSSQPHVSVLLVYPAGCPAFQKTVVALAEFLQGHGGCSLAVDLWQQGKIAELGPMRWLASQAEAADRVLVVCPKPISCHSNHTFLGPAIPASTNDLYPLVLNMVASHAKNPSELAMFWAVQLGESQDKRPGSLPAELAACKCFSLTKDLDKLCRSLHNKKQDFSILRKPEIFYNKKSTMKLQDAVKHLAEHQSSITAEKEHLNSVVITV
ncbi:Interleukin-17 receptor B [Merluccius polli]|uniref:Interleukin-17 receptor B n=1 Tax=Merluccius polli TaxID=89951 RepID=A0AA47P9P7_MERPO|nr:Interleukin-17 receptor B [Merluccius polli]